jgi:hypothetical protein
MAARRKESMAVKLNNYDQATVSMWGRGYAGVVARYGMNPLVEAAIAAVIAGLRRQREAPFLFLAYEQDAEADYQLIGSLLPEEPTEHLLIQVRDAAFHVRWLQLNGLNV